jgi:hypothetical protein
MKKIFTKKENIQIVILVLSIAIGVSLVRATAPLNPPNNDVSSLINISGGQTGKQAINTETPLDKLLAIGGFTYIDDNFISWNDATFKDPTPNDTETSNFFINSLNNTGATQEVCADFEGKLVLCSGGEEIAEDIIEDSCVPISDPYSYSACFVSDTKVLLSNDSEISIQDVKIGDILKGETTDNIVLGFHRPILGEKKLYSFNGGKYFVTAEHPFMTTNGWKALDPKLALKEHKLNIEIGQLEIGDVLVTENGNVELKTLDFKSDRTDTQLYNFILDGDHTYYADGYLVHNKAACDLNNECGVGMICIPSGYGAGTCSLHCDTIGESYPTSANCPIGYDYRYCGDDWQWHCTTNPVTPC